MSSPQQSECKSVSRHHRRRRHHRRSKSSSSSSSSSSDSSRHHRRHHKKVECPVQEGFFKECRDLWCPEGNLGPCHVYTIDDSNYSIPVHGFLKEGDQPIDLFAVKNSKNKGLGLAQTPENGINSKVYVQFDVSELVDDVDVRAFELCFDHLDCKGDIVEIYVSHTKGQLGKRLLKTKEKKVKICLKQHKFISVTLHSHHCSDKLGVLVECMCLYHVKPPAYAFVHTDESVAVALGAPIPFEYVELIRGFQQLDQYTLECHQRGIYGLMTTVDTLEPNACALYVNGVRAGGFWFGANATAQDIGQGLIKLKVGDKVQLINQSSQGGTIHLAPLGSGANPTVDQTTSALSIWRVD